MNHEEEYTQSFNDVKPFTAITNEEVAEFKREKLEEEAKPLPNNGVTRLDNKVSVVEEKTTDLPIIDRLKKDKKIISTLTKYLATNGMHYEYFCSAIIKALMKKNDKTGKTIIESCYAASIVEAITSSASVGVPPGVSGFGNLANFIPRGGECKFELTARGIIHLGARYGIIIKAGAVCGDDILESEEGGNGGKGYFKYIQKTYYVLNKDGEKVQGLRIDKGEKYFAWANLTKYGITIAVIMTREEMDYHKSKFPNKRWDTHYDEMAKKTCVNKLGKIIIPYLPLQVTIINEEEG